MTAALVLLVEDDEPNREMLTRRLERKGYRVVAAGDGERAIALAHSARPDVILLDMSLPLIDGYEAVKQLKAAVETRAIPVIGLSAHAMTRDRERALAAGCDDYETKPLDFARLIGKLDALASRGGQGP